MTTTREPRDTSIHSEQGWSDDIDLDSVLADVCRQLPTHSYELSQTGDFPLPVADLLSRSGLIGLCLPRRFGGGGRGLSDLVAAVETIARVDAATAWCLFILGTAPWILCRAHPALVDEVYADPAVRVAGTLAPTGILRPHGDEYVLNGRWTFGSAVNAAEWVAVHAIADGAVPGRSTFVIIPTTAITAREPWDGMGLSASGSGAFEVQDARVPSYRLIASLGDEPAWPEPTFGVPFRATFAACAAVLLGIARAMLTEFTGLALNKRPAFGSGLLAEQPHTQTLVSECWTSIESVALLLRECVLRIEATPVSAGAGSRLQSQAQLRATMVQVRSTCLGVVDRLHLAAGAAAAGRESRFAQLLRDAHTASQHYMFSADLGRMAGAVLLGLPVMEGQL